MKKNRMITFFLALVMTLGLALPARATDLSDYSSIVAKKTVDANAALLVNMTHDIIYYEQNAYDKVYPASITKVMTALVDKPLFLCLLLPNIWGAEM